MLFVIHSSDNESDTEEEDGDEMEFCEKTKPKNGYASAKYKDSFKKEGKAHLIYAGIGYWKMFKMRKILVCKMLSM